MRAIVKALLLPALAIADIDPAVFSEEQPLYKQNLRHGRQAAPSFLKYGHHLDQWAEDTVEQDLESLGDNTVTPSTETISDNAAAAPMDTISDNAAAPPMETIVDNTATPQVAFSPPPMALPGRHPSVEKALDGMTGDLQNLQDTQQAAKDARGELEGTVSAAFQHTNDAFAMKQAMAKKQAQLRRERGRIEELEFDEGKLDNTRKNLVSSLHRMLDPKIMKARVREEKKMAKLHKEETAAMAWKEKRDQLKSSAMEVISKKKASHQSLLQAEEEVAQAKKKEQLARIQYEHDRTTTAEKVQSYRYAETRFKAEMQHGKAASNAAKEAHGSVEKLHNVYGMEQQKVDQSIGFRKHRIEHQVHELQAAHQKSSEELTDLEQRYKEWQASQRERTAAVIKQSQDTEAASDAYAARQKQVLDTAQHKVAQDAEIGDWDGWGNDFTKATDELDD